MVESVFDDNVDASFLSTMECTSDTTNTPMQLPPTPRHQHETRSHGPGEEDHEAKRARVEAQKKKKSPE